MGWWEKETALYNLATHSMYKIVETFDPETGQVHKDEKGNLKVQVVNDWPISAGINGDREFNSFFDWAKHFNNYHPDVTDESLRNFYYHPIRYQTKLYNDRMNSLTIFSQEEQAFLQSYLWLRHWPEFFRPNELFSVMDNNQAIEKAKEMLESFEIKSGGIHCTDAFALQALIPYVKRLVQLFPEIKKNTERALPPDKFRDRVYQFETRRYLEEINSNLLEFQLDELNFENFLKDKNQQVLQLQTPDGEEWTGLIKVYQVLQNNKCLEEGQYTVLKLKHFLTMNRLMDLGALMRSTKKSHLLLMACEKNQQLNNETENMIRELFNTIQQKPLIKLIYTTQPEGKAFTFLDRIGREIFENGFDTRGEQINWFDLTISSQGKLLEKSVKFQGAKTSLNKLMTAESPAAKCLPLHALLEENGIKIADPVPISKEYNDNYYIGETLLHQIAIKHKIFSDKRMKFSDVDLAQSEQDSDVYLVRTEQKFKELCLLHPNSNVHWLQKDNSGKFLWQKSQGSLETLREYIDPERPQRYAHNNVDSLLQQAEKQREMLISDTAGMGKSTLLTHLSKKIKENSPEKWVVRIDLNDHTDALKAQKQETFNKEKAIEFVWREVLKLKPGLEVELFKEGCEHKQKVRIVIMLDGFDEISPLYKDTVIDLMEALRETAVEQLWVTTRPNLRKDLENNLQQLSYTIEPFSEENQIDFITKFWCLEDWYARMDNIKKEEATKKLKFYAKELIKNLAKSISDRDKEFTGIPLQCRLLAEAFDEEVNKFCQKPPNSEPEIPHKLDLFGLYKRFIERKYDIYLKEKCQVPENNVGAREQGELSLENMTEDHQLLALKVLFTEEDVKLFQISGRYRLPPEQLNRIGIAELNYEEKLRFIHRTFAEYYVADFFVNHFVKGSKASQQVQDYLLKNIFVKEQYNVVRNFIDVLMTEPETEKEVLKDYGIRISHLQEDCVQVLNQAAREGNVHIIGFLFDSLKVADHTDTLTKLLSAQDKNRQTAWHLAVLWGNIEVSQKLWEYAEEILWRAQINNKYLLATDMREMTAWHVAAEEGNLKMLQQLWEWAKERLTDAELNNNLLLANDSRGKIAWHMAAKSGNAEVLEKIWTYAKDRLTPEELKNKLLLATDKLRQTAWHYATWEGNIHLLQRLWQLAEEELTAQDLSNKLLLAKDKKGQTLWHMATERGNLELLERIWKWSREIQTSEALNYKLMLEKDKRERTVWHLAAECGNLKLLQKLWEWAKEVLTPEQIKTNFLLAGDEHVQTFLHVAAKGNPGKGIEEIWDWAIQNINQEVIKELLLEKDGHEQTVLNLVAKRSDTEVLEKMTKWAKEFLTPEEQRNAFGQRR
jgi:ankyrin repeat protein